MVLAFAACFRDHADVAESALTHVIQNPKAKTEYFTDTIVTMRVAKDAVDADIFCQQWRYSHFPWAARYRVLYTFVEVQW